MTYLPLQYSPLRSNVVRDTVGTNVREGEVLHELIEGHQIDRLGARQRIGRQLYRPPEPPELVCLLDGFDLKSGGDTRHAV